MTYSVKWVQTNVAFARRFEVYLDYPFFEHQVLLISTRGNQNILFGHFGLLSVALCFVFKASPRRRQVVAALGPWASAAPWLEPIWRPPRAPRRRFGGIGVGWTPQARKVMSYL
jgi:hypothetical protein